MDFKVAARTVLKLGAELISSDALAIYELVKKAIDAKSADGVEIHFCIAIKHSAFVDALSRAKELEGRTIEKGHTSKKAAFIENSPADARTAPRCEAIHRRRLQAHHRMGCARPCGQMPPDGGLRPVSSALRVLGSPPADSRRSRLRAPLSESARRRGSERKVSQPADCDFARCRDASGVRAIVADA